MSGKKWKTKKTLNLVKSFSEVFLCETRTSSSFSKVCSFSVHRCISRHGLCGAKKQLILEGQLFPTSTWNTAGFHLAS